MGTNIYLRPFGACATKCDNWIHLGKFSAGWPFLFRGYINESPTPNEPDFTVTDFDSWLKLLDLGEIYTEYGEPYTKEALLTRIDSKRDEPNKMIYENQFRDRYGNCFAPYWFS